MNPNYYITPQFHSSYINTTEKAYSYKKELDSVTFTNLIQELIKIVPEIRAKEPTINWTTIRSHIKDVLKIDCTEEFLKYSYKPYSPIENKAGDVLKIIKQCGTNWLTVADEYRKQSRNKSKSLEQRLERWYNQRGILLSTSGKNPQSKANTSSYTPNPQLQEAFNKKLGCVKDVRPETSYKLLQSKDLQYTTPLSMHNVITKYELPTNSQSATQPITQPIQNASCPISSPTFHISSQTPFHDSSTYFALNTSTQPEIFSDENALEFILANNANFSDFLSEMTKDPSTISTPAHPKPPYENATEINSSENLLSSDTWTSVSVPRSDALLQVDSNTSTTAPQLQQKSTIISDEAKLQILQHADYMLQQFGEISWAQISEQLNFGRSREESITPHNVENWYSTYTSSLPPSLLLNSAFNTTQHIQPTTILNTSNETEKLLEQYSFENIKLNQSATTSHVSGLSLGAMNDKSATSISHPQVHKRRKIEKITKEIEEKIVILKLYSPNISLDEIVTELNKDPNYFVTSEAVQQWSIEYHKSILSNKRHVKISEAQEEATTSISMPIVPAEEIIFEFDEVPSSPESTVATLSQEEEKTVKDLVTPTSLPSQNKRKNAHQ